jgi:hypothetical protein
MSGVYKRARILASGKKQVIKTLETVYPVFTTFWGSQQTHPKHVKTSLALSEEHDTVNPFARCRLCRSGAHLS